MKFTIFTPTFNRAKTLVRVYKSLIKQTNRDFIWLIVDDGSTDNTRKLVESWIKENTIEIEYHYKENGGKHTAMRMAWALTRTKYLLAIDSDDELTFDAVETFANEWKKIEDENLENQFAEVSGLTHSTNGKLIGNFYFPKEALYTDSFWHEMVLKNNNNNEHVVCWNVQKLRECVKIPERLWLSDKVPFPIYFGEATLWARIGKKYSTRYINKSLRIYHYDGGESILRNENKEKYLYSGLVGNKYFLDENLDYFFWNPKYFFNLILKFIIPGIELGYSPGLILRNINSLRFRAVYIITFPIGLMAWFYFKKIKKQFWF